MPVTDLITAGLYTDVVLPGLLASAFVYVRLTRASRYNYWQRRAVELGAVAMTLFVVSTVLLSPLISMVAIGVTVLLIGALVLGYTRREPNRPNQT
ncbi:hypothetical protein [Haladaptatus sp. NG-WS-4]